MNPEIDPEHPAEQALRALACWLGVGGYNAPTVDVKVFEAKIRDGVLVYSQAHGFAARELAEAVLDLGMVTPKGLRARDLARQVIGIVHPAALGNRTPARQEERQSLDALHGQIMNLPCSPTDYWNQSADTAYKEGHRDARHAAAELVAAFASSGPSEKEVGAAPLPVQGQATALEIALDALGEIALAGMGGTGMESEEAMTAWHARRAWEFIGIAARAKDAVRAALRASSAPTTKQGD